MIIFERRLKYVWTLFVHTVWILLWTMCTKFYIQTQIWLQYQFEHKCSFNCVQISVHLVLWVLSFFFYYTKTNKDFVLESTTYVAIKMAQQSSAFISKFSTNQNFFISLKRHFYNKFANLVARCRKFHVPIVTRNYSSITQPCQFLNGFH